jgi:hypothetical protein
MRICRGIVSLGCGGRRSTACLPLGGGSRCDCSSDACKFCPCTDCRSSMKGQTCHHAREFFPRRCFNFFCAMHFRVCAVNRFIERVSTPSWPPLHPTDCTQVRRAAQIYIYPSAIRGHHVQCQHFHGGSQCRAAVTPLTNMFWQLVVFRCVCERRYNTTRCSKG